MKERADAIRILHLEDDKRDAELIASLIAADELGAEIKVVDTKKDYLDALESETYDLILSDYTIPSFGGREALKLAREIAPSTPFIFVSGTIGEESAVDCLFNGATDYVLKQRPARFISAIHRALQESAERKAKEEAQATVLRLNADLERRVQERTEALEAANKDLESFAHSVSHDLRGPVRAIRGYSRMLQDDFGDRLDSEGLHYLSRIAKAGERMDQMIEALLRLSLVGRTPLEIADVDLSAIARTIAWDYSETDPSRVVQWIIQDGVTARADSKLIRSVLENLIGNAWKFSSEKSPSEIEFGLDEGGGRKTFFIRDNGRGFESARAAKIFDPFSRLNPDEETSGMGIGLSTVKRIIQLHHGTVWGEGKPGIGATFYFTLQEDRSQVPDEPATGP